MSVIRVALAEDNVLLREGISRLVSANDAFELVRARSQERQSGLSSLTPRESEILAEMAQGKSNAAIAAALFVTERAVEKHTNSIFAKLGLSEEKDVNRRVKAVLVFLSQSPGR